MASATVNHHVEIQALMALVLSLRIPKAEEVFHSTTLLSAVLPTKGVELVRCRAALPLLLN